MKSTKRPTRGKKAGAKSSTRVNDSATGTEPVNDQAPAKNERDDDFMKTALARYEDGYNHDRKNKDEAYQDLKFLADEDQWDAKAKQDRDAENLPVLIVNKTPQFVRQVTGDMRQMKPAIKVVPVDDRASKDVATKIWPGLIRYIEQRSDASGIYFMAADQQVGGGIGHWRVTHEYESTRTFNQEIRIAPIVDGIAVVWDSDAVLPAREDADWCFVPFDMSRREFERKHPDASADPLTESASKYTEWFGDDYVRICEYWQKVPQTKRLAMYPGGAIDDVTDDPEAEQTAIAAGAEIEEREGHKVQRALITANEVIEGPEDWPGPDIPIVPLLGEEITIARNTIRRGVVRVLKDVQRIFNYTISTQTAVVALQPKAPYIGTEKQFEKYVDEWETANSRNWPYLQYTPDGQAPPPQRVAPPAASTGLDDLMRTVTESMHETTGIYPASLGAKSNETSGRAIMARQREGDTGTYVYVDNFARAIRRTGQIIVNMAPQIYDTARTIRIVGEDGKIDHLEINQPQAGEDGQALLLNDLTVGAYEVSIEMGPGYSTKREEAREGMTALMQAAGPEIAQLYMDLFVKMQDWPLADKIAKRAQMLLPPAIQQMEAHEAGERPPQMPPPPPPTPEQQEKMQLEQRKAQEEQQRNIELARKNEVEDFRLKVEMKRLEVEEAALGNERFKMECELETARLAHSTAQITHESAKVSHAATVEKAHMGAVADQQKYAATDRQNQSKERMADATLAQKEREAIDRGQDGAEAPAESPSGEGPSTEELGRAIEQLSQMIALIAQKVSAMESGQGQPSPQDIAPEMPAIDTSNIPPAHAPGQEQPPNAAI